MKTLVLAAFTTLPFLSTAQTTSNPAHIADNGVYLSATDFKHHLINDGFDNAQAGYHLRDELFKSAVKIITPDNQNIEIPAAQVWGERKSGVDYRRFNGDLYRVEHTDRIYVYSRPTDLSGIGQNAKSLVTYYFSRKADSPIHAITTNVLKDIFYDQPEKVAAFDKLDNLSSDPAQQASQLIRLFYTSDTSAPATAE
ncbi:hypothetical protein GCM10027341_23120 [Spirosoma knui]